MTRSKIEWLLIAMALAAGGCDDKASGDGKSDSSAKPEGKTEGKPEGKAETKPASAGAQVASCNLIKQESICREWGEANISAAGEDHLKNMCTGGEYKTEGCPKDKRVGSCVTPEGTKMFYSEGPIPFEAAKAEKACKEGIPAGEWKAG